MIVATLVSGFGNQLFQYAAAYALARRTGDALAMDTSFFATQSLRAYQLDRLAITARPISPVRRLLVKVSRHQPRTAVRSVLKRAAVPALMHVVSDETPAGAHAYARAGRNTVLVGYWQSEAYFADAADDLRREFAFKTPPNEFNRGVIDRMKRQPAVGVHVRRGDYLKPGEIVSACGVPYYRAAIGRMTRDVPDAKFFVFSDDPEWARANLPLPADSEFVSGNLGVSDTDDLRLMSHCDHFVIANSTFSWWGAWLSPSPGKRVIAPRPWFNGPNDNEETIVPARWLRLGAE